ncbi:MAG: DUF4234 domain-containing protein [Chloroflexota bacterium]
MRGTVRSPGMVVLLVIVTCGIYAIVWFFRTLNEMREAGYGPTANTPLTDFLVIIATCGLYALFMDYRISKSIVEMQEALGLPPHDTSTLCVILDVLGLRIVTIALHQNELNKVWSAVAADEDS